MARHDGYRGTPSRHYPTAAVWRTAKAQVEAVLAEYDTLGDFNTSMSYSANDDEYENQRLDETSEVVTVRRYPYTKLQFYGTNGFRSSSGGSGPALFLRNAPYASWW